MLPWSKPWTLVDMNDRAYVKLFSSIVTSSMWSESPATRIVWVTMLAMKDNYQEVHAAIPGLARAANVPLKDTEAAIKKFLSPDPYSRTKDHEGRRIEEIPGGWRILNGEYYRKLMSIEERREYKRIKEAERRARMRGKPVDKDGQAVTERGQKSAETETETEIRGKEAPQSFEKASPTARLILHEKELGRVTEKMKSIKASYSEHQSMSSGDKEAFMKLRERKLELQKLLGVTA